MFAYDNALSIDGNASAHSLAVAADRLINRKGVVLLDDKLALRPTHSRLYCEVIDPEPSAHRCEQEYAVLVENARRIFEASSLSALLSDVPRLWLVVAETNGQWVQVWRAAD
ncbi:MAG: hypothetical protein QM808_03085 [Steroidobacteraceae bacterium]